MPTRIATVAGQRWDSVRKAVEPRTDESIVRRLRLGLDALLAFALLAAFLLAGNDADLLVGIVPALLALQAIVVGLRGLAVRVAIASVTAVAIVAVNHGLEAEQMLAVPVMAGACLLVTLAVVERQRRAAAALGHQQTVAARHLVEHELERRDAAQALDSQVAQTLAAISLNLGAATSRLEERHPARDMVERSLELTTAAIGASRDVARRLAPGVLDDLGLVAALRDLAARGPLPATFSLEAGTREPGLSDAAALAVYRFAEAAVQHAENRSAGRCRISVACRDGDLVLRIADDGRGLDGDALEVEQADLAARALLGSGTATIRSRPGLGTLVILRAPIDAGPEVGAPG